MKTQTYAETLELKIEVINSFIDDLMANTNKDRETGSFLWVLIVFEHMLVSQRDSRSLDFDDLEDIKRAIRKCGSILYRIAEDEPEDMKGWLHGIVPRNQSQALANAISQMILDFGAVVFAFESHYPEMRTQFDAERSYHARQIEEAE